MTDETKEIKIHAEDRRKYSQLPEGVPIGLLNEEWAEKNHQQSLEKLNLRGGLGVMEMLDNIHRRKLSWRSPTQKDVAELLQFIVSYMQEDSPAPAEMSAEAWQQFFQRRWKEENFDEGHEYYYEAMGEFTEKIVQEYASLKAAEEREKAIAFGAWLLSLSPVDRCTVHSPGGSGIFLKTPEELYKTFARIYSSQQ